MGLFRRRSRFAGVNLLDLRPERCVDYRANGQERVVLLVPRFRSGPLARWLQPRLGPDRAFIRVHLDPRGSWIWLNCDGRTVGDLVEGFRDRFPAERNEVPERVCRFVYQLDENRYVRLSHSTSSVSGPDSPV